MAKKKQKRAFDLRQKVSVAEQKTRANWKTSISDKVAHYSSHGISKRLKIKWEKNPQLIEPKPMRKVKRGWPAMKSDKPPKKPLKHPKKRNSKSFPSGKKSVGMVRGKKKNTKSKSRKIKP